MRESRFKKIALVGAGNVAIHLGLALKHAGLKVEGDTLVITVKGGKDAARELCGALIEEMNK